MVGRLGGWANEVRYPGDCRDCASTAQLAGGGEVLAGAPSRSCCKMKRHRQEEKGVVKTLKDSVKIIYEFLHRKIPRAF